MPGWLPPPIVATEKSRPPLRKTQRHRARLPLNGNELLLCDTPPARFRGDSSNVDQVLTKMRTAYTQAKQSAFKILFYLYNLVAGVGFEPTTFRL